MREVDVAGLLAADDDPILRHHLDPATVRRAWVAGGATVVEHAVAWDDAPPGALGVLCLGPPCDLDPLVARLADAGVRPWRVVVEATSAAALPASWRSESPHAWHWMWTRTPPAPRLGGPAVVVLGDRQAEVDAVLATAAPGSFARSGAFVAETWVGVEDDDGTLVAVGALTRRPDGTGQLRGIATRPDHAGRGLASAVSAELTRRALATGTGIATLGVYTDNERALGVYERLGYRVGHTFVAGVAGRVVSTQA